MAGYTRTDTTNNIADGNIINATDLDNEFDGIQSAFNSSTGHNHDGTTGEGAPILVLGPTQDVVVGAAAVTPKTTNTVDLGSGSLKFKDLHMAGNALVGGTLGVTGVATLTAQPILSSLTASQAVFTDASKGLVSNAITGTGNVVMSNSPTLVTPALGIPSSGTVTNLTGTASININGTVGATTASTGAFTTLTTSSTVTLSALTATRVPYASTGGLLVDSANMVFNGTRLTVADLADSGLTSGRVTYASTGGALVDSANLTFDGTNFVVGGGSAFGGAGYTALTLNNATNGGVLNFANGATLVSQLYGIGNNITLATNQSGSTFTLNPFTAAVFQLAGSEQMRLTSTGLGIGTTSPLGKLGVVSGTAPNIATLYVGLSGSNNYYDANTHYFRNGSQVDTMTLTSTGLGIGTSSPGAKLTVAAAEAIRMANASPYLSFYNGAQSTRFGYIQHNGTNLSLVNEQAGSLEVYTNNTVRAIIDSSGNLGLGVTPSAWTSYKVLQLAGSAYLYGFTNDEIGLGQGAFFSSGWKYAATGVAATWFSAYRGGYIWNTAPSGTAGDAISFTQAMSLTAGGSLLVGTTTDTSSGVGPLVLNKATNPGYVVAYNGTERAYQYMPSSTRYRGETVTGVAIEFSAGNSNGVSLASGGTSWGSLSDERKKDIIEPITNAANKVSTLRAVIGKYKTDNEGARRAFLIAQDVQAALPEAVVENENGDLILQYTDTIPLLVAAIQELKAEFDAYKAAHP